MSSIAIIFGLSLVTQIEKVDLATRYRSFDALHATNRSELAPHSQIALERDFDQFSETLFFLSYGRPVEILDECIDRLKNASIEPNDSNALSWYVRSGPTVVSSPAGTPLRFELGLALSRTFDEEFVSQVHLELRRFDAATGLPDPSPEARIGAADLETTVDPYGVSVLGLSIPIERWPQQMGRYCLVLAPRGVEIATIQFMSADPDAMAASLRMRLAKLREPSDTTDALRRAVGICEGRLTKLRSNWNGMDTFVLSEDLETFSQELTREVEAIERGEDPYHLAAGESWRVLELPRQRSLPFRVAAPRNLRPDERLPIVFALHALAGDENMFFHGYGRGILRRLVDEKRFLAVTPAMPNLSSHPERLLALLADLEHDFPIDRQRVHLIGHSSGGGPSMELLGRFSTEFASGVTFAVGTDFMRSPVPLAAYFGEMDRLSVLFAVNYRSGVLLLPESQKATWPRIEIHELAGRGHTLMVGDLLPEAVDFLLAHPRPSK